MADNFVHLNSHTWYSFLWGGSSPENLVKRAAEISHTGLAITDVNGMYGCVGFQRACAKYGIKPIIGVDLRPELFRGAGSLCSTQDSIILLAKDTRGYKNLCSLLTVYHVTKPKNFVQSEHVNFSDGVICITGSSESRLWRYVKNRENKKAVAWLKRLKAIYGDYLFVELVYHENVEEKIILKRLISIAEKCSVKTVATNSSRYARIDDFKRFDLQTCIRLGITLDSFHPGRSKNTQAYLKYKLNSSVLPKNSIFATKEIADVCDCNILKETVVAPAAKLPKGVTGNQFLARLCYSELLNKYEVSLVTALRQLNKELCVIYDLNIADFFLVVREVVKQARCWGIRCSGRGSAANSIVAYLLGITQVDPIEHGLLFERFLHRGRKGTPDIDIDFDSERREEIIGWIESRFGIEHTAMTGTMVTFRLRLALREVLKVYGFTNKKISKITKLVPHTEPNSIREFTDVLGKKICRGRLELILNAVESLQDCPRHLGLHSGGMVLSNLPLSHFTPIQVSKNGVKVIQFDKDDLDHLGLIKLDVLGLRMLASISEAEEMVNKHYGKNISLDCISHDDEKVYQYLRSGKSLGTFQIESQGQMHLLAVHEPNCFNDLISQIALFRPGPLQGGMVHPYIRRRKGLESVSYDHPDLEPILKDTYGIILFQEQILEIANQFSGMSLAAADDFRSEMSKRRSQEKLLDMRNNFISGAVYKGVDRSTATIVFDKVANFVGYGFCRSHAAAFAKIVYQSVWLKLYFPAAYMAAVMQHHPGMYPLQTLEEEAKRLNVRMLSPDINRSHVRYTLEVFDHKGPCIRKPLTSVIGISINIAKRIVWARMVSNFSSIEDIFRRTVISRDALVALGKGAALDSIAESRRRAIWEIGLMFNRKNLFEQPNLFSTPVYLIEEVPDFPELSLQERIAWDLETQRTSMIHPLSFFRRYLNEFSVKTIELCRSITSTSEQKIFVRIAGLAILKQKPPTANGVMFITLEDETGYIQTVIFSKIQKRYEEIIRSSALLVEGILQNKNGWLGLTALRLYKLDGISGGYVGHANSQGGREEMAIQTERFSSVKKRVN
ncbi:MAG: DNA polymerase III subunit alpha [Candidatus Latescibacterota bacterium]|nr:DNA polymerase III subunit alpha [Candidatus Latescibacterota bacterium]